MYCKQLNSSQSCPIYEIGIQQFRLLVPQNDNDIESNQNIILVDYDRIIPGYEWIGRLNEQIIDYGLVSTNDIIEHIESIYKKKLQSSHIGEIQNDITDKINMFELEETAYRNRIKSLLELDKKQAPNTKSKQPSEIFNSQTASNIIINEFFDMRKKYQNSNIMISLNQNNIFNWKLQFKHFDNHKLNAQLIKLNKIAGYNYIEIDVQFSNNLYPNYPPDIKISKPVLNRKLMTNIPRLKMTNADYWNPCRNMDYIVSKLSNILNTFAKISFKAQLNISNIKLPEFDELDIMLSKFLSLSSVDYTDPLDDTVYTRITAKNIQNSGFGKSGPKNRDNLVWKPGTGYGSGSDNDWDSREYMKLCEEKDRQTVHLLEQITRYMQKIKPSGSLRQYDKLQGSCIMPYVSSKLDSTFLDINNNIKLYHAIFEFLNVFVNSSGIRIIEQFKFIDKLKGLYNESKTIQNIHAVSDQSTNIDDEYLLMNLLAHIYEKIESIYAKYLASKAASVMNASVMNVNVNASVDTPVVETSPETTTVESTYVKILNELAFDTIQFDQRFSKFSGMSTSGANSKTIIRRISHECVTLMKNLPISYGSSIFVRVNEENTTMMKVLITGPEHTPYDSGCFIFDVYLPETYPNCNPRMQFVNHGTRRFNPNLYNCGKVCLSLLGTWGSNQWDPKISTLLQLFVSVQSQILVDEPYFNEPGYEKDKSEQSMARSKAYNDERRYYTLQHTMLEIIENPGAYPEFKDVIVAHFKIKKDYIAKLCDKWVIESSKYKDNMKNITQKLKPLLSAL